MQHELDIGAMFASASGTWKHRVDGKSVVWAFPHLEAQVRFDGDKVIHVTPSGETAMAFTFKAKPWTSGNDDQLAMSDMESEASLAKLKRKFLELKQELAKRGHPERLTSDIKSDVLQLLENAGVKEHVSLILLYRDMKVGVCETGDNDPGLSYVISVVPGSETVEIGRRDFKFRALVPLARQTVSLMAIIDEAISFGLIPVGETIRIKVSDAKKSDSESDSDSKSESGSESE